MQTQRGDLRKTRPPEPHPVGGGTKFETERPRGARWSSVGPGRSLFWFPTVVASLWALTVGFFSAVTVLLETEEGASWGEAVTACVGNFAFAWVIAFVVSVVVLVVRRHREADQL